ncbi:MAG: T9SS type A sorting domain-containing protein [Bacteroidetes bacterium]|nr:T9SS type A sorting domain-containing protein [Bacteroidota bacterium]
MRKVYIAIMMATALSGLSFVLSDNGKAGVTGSPGEVTCADATCHDSNSLNSGLGSITIDAPTMPGWQYVAGQVYPISVTVAQTGVTLFGIGFEALKADGSNGGTLTITNSAQTQIKNAVISGKVRANIVHKLNGGMGVDTETFTFNWTAPATSTGAVTFYAAGNASNADEDITGDFIYTTTQVVTPSTVGFMELNGPVASISHFPNPVDDHFATSLTLSEPATVSIEIMDIKGNLISKLSTSSYSSGEQLILNHVQSGLASGSYLINVRVNNRNNISKITKL